MVRDEVIPLAMLSVAISRREAGSCNFAIKEDVLKYA